MMGKRKLKRRIEHLESLADRFERRMRDLERQVFKRVTVEATMSRDEVRAALEAHVREWAEPRGWDFEQSAVEVILAGFDLDFPTLELCAEDTFTWGPATAEWFGDEYQVPQLRIAAPKTVSLGTPGPRTPHAATQPESGSGPTDGGEQTPSCSGPGAPAPRG